MQRTNARSAGNLTFTSCDTKRSRLNASHIGVRFIQGSMSSLLFLLLLFSSLMLYYFRSMMKSHLHMIEMLKDQLVLVSLFYTVYKPRKKILEKSLCTFCDATEAI